MTMFWLDEEGFETAIRCHEISGDIIGNIKNNK